MLVVFYFVCVSSIRLEFYVKRLLCIRGFMFTFTDVHFEFSTTTKDGIADVAIRCLLAWRRVDYISRWVQIYLRQIVTRQWESILSTVTL